MITRTDAKGVKELLQSYQEGGDYSKPFILVDKDSSERRTITNDLWNILWNSVNPISIGVVNNETQCMFERISAEFAENPEDVEQTLDEYIKHGCWYKHIYGGSEFTNSVNDLIQLCKLGSNAKMPVVVVLTNINDSELAELDASGVQLYLLG